MTTVLAAVVAALLAARVAWWVLRRPQRGVLLLAALVPFDGLLLVLPGGGPLGPWKEGLTLAVLAATLVAPAAARGEPRRVLPPWGYAVIAYATLGLVAAAVAADVVGLWGLKVGYFYLLLPLALWRCPLSALDRDRLVTILMATGALTAVIGLAQQVVGEERLAALGYEYNTTIRTAGGLLRAFSTFTQPFSFGLFVMLVLLVCLPVALSDPRRTRNLAFLVVSPVLVLGMATSVVRGAFLGLAVGGLALVVWRYRSLLHALGPVLVGVVLLPPAVLAAFASSTSLGQRTSGWSVVLEEILGAPLGHGIGYTGAAAERALQGGADQSQVLVIGGEFYLPDNQYVKQALELGPLGVWLLLLVGASVVVAGRRVARQAQAQGRVADRALAEGIAASVVGAAAASLVSTYLEIFPLDVYFWLLLGVVLCLDRPRPPSTGRRSPSAPEAAVSRPTSASSSVP